MFISHDKIKELKGMDELKRFADKLVAAKENLDNRKIKTQIPLPNVILAAAPGCGTSRHIRLLADLLREAQLFSFAGEENIFEWALSRKDDSFSTLLRRIQTAAGFYGQFKGVIGLDLSEVLDQQWPESAKRLMEYVDAQQGNILFVFVIPYDTEPHLIKRLQVGLASRTPVEIIHTPFPNTDIALEYVLDAMKKRQIRCDDSTSESILRDAIDFMRKSPAFDGYQSLQNLIDELSWHIISKTGSDFAIHSENLNFLKGDDGYLALFRTRSHGGSRIIGFDTDRRNA